MPKWKPARAKKKPERTPMGGAIGCVLFIVLALVLFAWFFSAALRPS